MERSVFGNLEASEGTLECRAVYGARGYACVSWLDLHSGRRRFQGEDVGPGSPWKVGGLDG